MIGLTSEVINNGLDSSEIETKNIWRKRKRGRGGGSGMSTTATYTQVENALILHWRYSQIL